MMNHDEAIAIAKARASERGWALREPLSVTERRSWSGKLRTYKVVSDPRMRGTKAHFTIDAVTGAILDEGYLSR